MTGCVTRAARVMGVACVNVTVWRVGAGLRRVPRVEERYVVVPPDGARATSGVWLAGAGGGPAFVDGHLSVELAGSCPCPPGVAERADVLLVRAGESGSRPGEEVDAALGRYPGCLVALAPGPAGGCVAGARDGGRVVATPVAGSRRHMTGRERAGFASFLHARLVLGRPWAGGGGSVVHAVGEGGAADPLWLRVRPLT